MSPATIKKTVCLMHKRNHDIDRLTGLPKRPELEKQLTKLSFNKGTCHALCQIDIDSFMVVNDVYGHASGDKLLVAITSLIQDQIGSVDFLARIGNDEFGLIIRNCNYNYALFLACMIRNEIKKLRISDSYHVTASIGITMLNKQCGNAKTHMRNVDIACRSAKQTGDKVQLYQGNDQFTVSYHRDMQWIKKIQSALEEDRLELYAQEIAPLTADESTTKPIVFEILTRIAELDGSLTKPGDFLPIAAKHNLSSRIDLTIIQKTFYFLNRYPNFSKRCSMIMINLSAQSLGDEIILDYLSSQLRNANFPPSIICFEITETEDIKNIKSAVSLINLIKSQFGCHFAIDDFGAGFSSFSYIKELPIDIIKLDGKFVKELNSSPFSHLLVQAICDIARLTHKTTIAEWVETKEILDIAQDMGINYAQGYYLDHPKPLYKHMKKLTDCS